jgi:hypothetical protein
MKLLTPAYVAAELHIKPQTLRIKRMRGDEPPFIRLSDSPTSRVFYPEAEFVAWLATRLRRISTAEENRHTPLVFRIHVDVEDRGGRCLLPRPTELKPLELVEGRKQAPLESDLVPTEALKQIAAV